MSKKSVKVYSLTNCIYCEKAKDHLKKIGQDFTEIVYDKKTDMDEIMDLVNKTDRNSFPQIFVDDVFIGGFEHVVEYFDDIRFDSEF